MQRLSHCTQHIDRPSQRIEVTALEDVQGTQYAVLECDDADDMRWLRSEHQSAHEAAYAAAQYAQHAGLPLWFPTVDGERNPMLQALEDVLFAEGVIAYCTQQVESLWHPVQYSGYAAASARYPELAGRAA
jgi:hypothetical protein